MPLISLRRNDNFKRKSSIFGATIYHKGRHGAKRQPLPASVKTDTTNNKTTLTRQTISLFLDTNRPDFSDTQADPKGFKNFPTAHFKK